MSFIRLPAGENANPNDEARKILDIEIFQLEARLTSLRRTRNTLAPIARLHHDILQEIFVFTCLSSITKGKTSIILSWISREWRDLAHQTSDIWTHIDFTHPEWIGIALSRVKDRKLEFNLSSMQRKNQDHMEPLADLCLANLPRIQTLHIVSKYGRDLINPHFPRFNDTWATPAPFLQDLNLFGLYLPPSLFSGNSPALQSLILSSSEVDWDTFPQTPNLKRLHLEDMRPCIPADTMVHVLRQVGSVLEELSIKYALTERSASDALSGDANPPTSLGRVNFPNLKHLDIQEWTETIVSEFFDIITIPNFLDDTNLVFSTWDDGSFPQAFLSARGISAWEIDSLDCKMGDGVIKFGITESRSYLEANSINDILSPSVTTLSLSGGYGPDTLRVFEYFGGLGTVDQLVLGPACFGTFITSIAGPVNQLGANQTSSLQPVNGVITIPTKSLISFYNLVELKIEWDTEEGNSISLQDVDVLRKWLEWRNKAELRLERLTISEITSPEPLGTVRKMLGNLVETFDVVDVREEEDTLEVEG